MITEFGYDYGVLTTRHPFTRRDYEHRLALTLGHMWNTSPGVAYGITGSAGGTDVGPVFRLEGRRRWWHSDVLGTDVSAGFVAQDIPMPSVEVRAYGATAAAAIEYRSVALTARGDMVSTSERTSLGMGLGVRAGAKSGAVTFAIYAAGVLTIVALIMSGD